MGKTQIGSLSISKKKLGTLPIQKEVLNGVVVYQETPAPSVDPVLNNNSWAVIKQVCEAGQASNYWAVGDTKTDLGTDGNTRTFRIADMQGLYNKHCVFEQVGTNDTSLQWNTSTHGDGNYYNNYSISVMKNTNLPAYELLLSSDLQATLTSTTVKVARNGGSSTILEVSGKLFLPAEKEIRANPTNARTEESAVLTTWQYYTTNTSASDRIKYDSTNTARAYWTRSPSSQDSYNNVVYVASNGGVSNFYGDSKNYIAPCFAL